MSHDNIQARGTVIEVLKDGAYRVELANGHRAFARAAKGTAIADLKTGDRVALEFHPYDLSRGHIIA